MIKHPNKILYIGAGSNIEPIIHFSETKEFVFIDSQPRIKNEKLYLETSFNKNNYIPNFVNNLMLSCLYYGFELESKTIIDKKYYKKIMSKKWCYISFFKKIPKHINPTMLVFINQKTQQKIIYYISTNLNLNIDANLRYDISSSDAIIVTEYFPEIDILDYFGTLKLFIGYSNINYRDEDDNNFKNDILYFLRNYSCNRQYFFSDFYIVDKNTGNIHKCKDFNNFLLCNVKLIDKKIC